MSITVAIVGASHKPERYSNKAVSLLKERGYDTIPVNPTGREIHSIPSVKSLDDIKKEIHTITLYVGKQISDTLVDPIIKANPQRVIFNPGAENSDLRDILEEKGINTIEACTIVMLTTDQF